MERLADLLREAETEHGKYERMLGHRDETWADWYAENLVRRLPVLRLVT